MLLKKKNAVGSSSVEHIRATHAKLSFSFVQAQIEQATQVPDVVRAARKMDAPEYRLPETRIFWHASQEAGRKKIEKLLSSYSSALESGGLTERHCRELREAFSFLRGVFPQQARDVLRLLKNYSRSPSVRAAEHNMRDMR